MTRPYEADMLLAQARQAMAPAYAPYSQFKVGAALLTASGEVVLGCNVENASYGLTNCAERSALFNAISGGHREFVAIAIVASGSAPHTPTGDTACTPCGACRQVLAEFSPGMHVILEHEDGTTWDVTLGELLPHQFVLKVDATEARAKV